MRISVVVRTRDKERYFDRLLEIIGLQTVGPSEIIVVDNYSSEEKLQMFQRELVEIEKSSRNLETRIRLLALSDVEFSHPYSTNLGVQAAENELVCLTNGHSIPVSHRWLQDGLRYFEDDKIAGVSGFFVPHMEGNNITGKFDAIMYYLSQRMVLHQDWCSTVNCIIRKSLWRMYPFDENLPRLIPETRKYGLEDYDWSKEMVARGYRIIVDPRFSVFHSHGNGYNELVRNARAYFIYRGIQKRIDLFERPRKSFSRVL